MSSPLFLFLLLIFFLGIVKRASAKIAAFFTFFAASRLLARGSFRARARARGYLAVLLVV